MIHNGDSDNTNIPTMEEVDIDALVERCIRLLKECQHCDHSSNDCKFNNYEQIFIGIAGTPGSGKSFIAEKIRDTINARNLNGAAEEPECVVVPMDGYHLKREQLKKKAEAGELFKTDQEDADGNPVYRTFTYDQLMARRGAAFTYCPENFIRDLKNIKESGEGSFPVYSREKHDPVPNGVFINKQNKIILVEGLYLLCLHDLDWKPLDDLWDDKWFIEVSAEETKRRLVKRHLKHWDDQKTKRWGGSDEAAAARKAEDNDLKNAACIKKFSLSNANLIIRNEIIPETDGEKNADTEAAEDS
jgi:pantothenate kinase